MKTLLLLLSVVFALAVPPLPAQDSPPRTALVMGVGDYGGAKYKGKSIQDLPGITTSDLPQMAAKLEALGFDVTVVPNPSLSQAKTAVDTFSARIKARPGVSLFYFSGHGGEYEGKNYLIPRGASIASTADLSDEALSAQRVLNGMEESGAQVNLVFLDCCREDLGKNIGGAEMAPLRAKGSFIGFATRSGDFADPEEQGSPYTRFLLKHLDKPGVSVTDMYGYVAQDVKDYSKRVLGEERTPGFYSELAGAPFYLVPVKFTNPNPPSPVPSPGMTEAEIERRARELAAQMAAEAAGTGVPGTLKREPRTEGSVLDQGAVGKAIQVKLPGDVLIKFAYCPPGSFMMGSPTSEKDRSDVEDQVQVRISKGFWMGQTEVTQGQWAALMGSNPSNFKGNDLPVESVSWNDAQAFITKLNQSVPLPAGWKYALPTEAQWEYACRAGTESVFSFGDRLNGTQANCNGNFPYGMSGKGPSLGRTYVVGNYAPNAWGLYDMHGNVWEWCADWYGEKLPGGSDPVGARSGADRVIRGGSWKFLASFCRAAFRHYNIPSILSDNLGFRLAIVPSK
jgi:formylglycine-generating enzyme required for sulfatase activity